MMDKRAPIRQYFQDEANKADSIQQFKARTAQLDALEGTVIKAFNTLIRYMDGKTSKTEVVNQLKSISTPDVDKVVTALSKLDKDILTNKLDLKPITDALNSLKREVTLIPGKMPSIPEQKEAITVKNLDEITLDTSDLEKAIKALKLDPTIDVKAPVVNVDAPDLSPIKSVLLDVVKAIKAQKPVEIPKTDLSTLETESQKTNKQLEDTNKHLKKLIEKPTGGGGGGGGHGTPYITDAGKAVYANAIPSTSIPTITAITVVNPDGTNVGASGQQSITATVTSVASALTPVLLLMFNENRRTASFFNDGTQILYLKFGLNATTSTYTVQVPGGAFYELPQPCYTGSISGVWTTINGSVRVTEAV